jgi:archaetidylserine synthase
MQTKSTRNITPASMVTLVKLPDLLSILNALLGFTAILLVFGDTSVTEKALKNALILIVLAAVVDGLDGIVARKIECSSLGEYLDSLADMLSFGVAPAIVAYTLIKNYFGVAPTYITIALAFCGAYVISGMLRLARFNANLFAKRKALPSGQSNDFEGFPITGGAIFLASLMLLAIELPFPPSPSVPLLIGSMGLLCVLMTSRIRYKKPRDKRIVIPVGIVFFSLFVFYICSLAFVYSALLVFILTGFYMCSPLLYKKEKILSESS